MLQTEADSAKTQKGIALQARVIGEYLVATDIEGPEGDGLAWHAFHQSAVNSELLVLGGKGTPDHEGEFGAVKPDAFGMKLSGGSEIGEKVDIHQQPNPDAILGESHRPHRLFVLRDPGSSEVTILEVSDHLLLRVEVDVT
jgi:hypothetical protein